MRICDGGQGASDDLSGVDNGGTERGAGVRAVRRAHGAGDAGDVDDVDGDDAGYVREGYAREDCDPVTCVRCEYEGQTRQQHRGLTHGRRVLTRLGSRHCSST